jgi:transketolase C-terminal domain/subunit
LKKTGQYLTVEDHNPYSGLSSAVSKLIMDEQIPAKKIAELAVTAYELSGKAPELYNHAKIDSEAVLEVLNSL